MNNYITYHYDSDSASYEVYIALQTATTPYACLIHGTDQIPLSPNPVSGFYGTYIKLPDSDTFEIHVVDGDWINDYYKAEYATGSGVIVATNEHNVSTTFNQIS